MDINSIVRQSLNNLFSGNRIFNSEADFQFALAWQIKEDFPEVDIRLEYTPWKFDRDIRIDIAVFINSVMIPIELKYKTKLFENEAKEINLKNQGAQDIGRYDFLSDIERLENIIDERVYNIEKAYAIFLTNDSLYWKKPKSNKRITVDADFRFHDGITLTGIKKWNDMVGAGTQKNREAAITLRGIYEVNWEDYIPINECPFKFLVIEIMSS